MTALQVARSASASGVRFLPQATSTVRTLVGRTYGCTPTSDSVPPSHLNDRVVVFGSAPMVFAGLKPDVTNDLDLFVSDETFLDLIAAGFPTDEQKPGVPRIALAEDVEVFKTWIGVGFLEVHTASSPLEGSRGLRVAALHHVLEFKLASNREKDGPDIAALQHELERRAIERERP